MDKNDRQRALTAWNIDEGALTREFRFKDFTEAFEFMTKVAVEAEKLNHHPDWSNSYNRVVIRLTSHDAGAVTDKDYSLATRINELAAG
jgi:4a-hydroxytetrahydrobiopterin dehydratase